MAGLEQGRASPASISDTSTVGKVIAALIVRGEIKEAYVCHRRVCWMNRMQSETESVTTGMRSRNYGGGRRRRNVNGLADLTRAKIAYTDRIKIGLCTVYTQVSFEKR